MYPGIEVIPIDLNENGKLDPDENFYGTLDEITEVLSLNQLSIIDKPCALLNVKGFFKDYIKRESFRWYKTERTTES